MREDGVEYLELADWRRRIAALYAEVRERAAADPAEAVMHWRAVREELYRTHPQSPIPAERREDFRARHFPYDPALRFAARVVADAAMETDPQAEQTAAVPIPTSQGPALALERIGWVDLPFAAGPRRLALYWMAGYAGGLYLPFRDATNGAETYAAGRYLLDAAKGADLGGDMTNGTLVLDFNVAYHPSCAFDPRWACPLTPPENRLDLPIRAGERLT